MSDDGGSRRRFLYLTGSATLAGLAGCSGGGGGGDGGGEETPESTPTPSPTPSPTPTSGGGGGSGSDLGPVPAEYETATAIGGTERNPDAVASKSAVQYQSDPKDGQQCSNCTYYIEDKNDDGLGACAIVEGKVEPSGWCASYAEYEG